MLSVAVVSPVPYEAVVKNAAAYICNAMDRKLVAGHFPGIGPEKYPCFLVTKASEPW